MANVKEIIKNIEAIHNSSNSLQLLKDFERVLDELDLYVYENWIDGEIVSGPRETRYFVECVFSWPHDKMPEPIGGKKLTDYGCKVQFAEDQIAMVRRIKTPDDIRPGTRKGKIDHEDVWMVKITIPKKLMHDINRGYTELDRNKISDVLPADGGVNAIVEPAEEQQQDMDTESNEETDFE